MANLLSWGKAIYDTFKGSSDKDGGNAAQYISQQSAKTQEQLASISARQIMEKYDRERESLTRKGTTASQPPQKVSPQQKSRTGLQIIYNLSRAAVNDQIYASLIQKQPSNLGKSVSSEVDQVIQTTYGQSETGTETRTRRTAKGSFLDSSTGMTIGV